MNIHALHYALPQQSQAEHWQQQLAAQGWLVPLRLAEQPFSARWLRQHTDLVLLCDHDGLWLAADGMKMQPDWLAQLPRLKRANPKNELAARACQVEQKPQVIDATAGLGHDAILLAWLGAQVTLIERHPVVFALLQSALAQAQQQPALQAMCGRVQLRCGDAAQVLSQLQTELQADVVYLDPMFPHAQSSKKAAPLVKKDMQLLHRLFADSALEGADQALEGADQAVACAEALLTLARHSAPRVIVKRPRHAEPLGNLAPDHRWLGDACRFDGYFAASLQDHCP